MISGAASSASALNTDMQSPTITIVNGAAAMIAACWSEPRPPASSRTAAEAPVATPHTMTTGRGGVRLPREDSMPITSDAASAPLTKNSATSTITTNEVRPASGNSSSIVNSAISGVPTIPPRSVPPSWRSIAAPPKTANQTKLTPLGIRSTPMTNSRTVRPFEMRAMKVPTKGAHEIHHAQ